MDEQGKPIIRKEEDLYQDISTSQFPLVKEISNLIQSKITLDEEREKCIAYKNP